MTLSEQHRLFRGVEDESIAAQRGYQQDKQSLPVMAAFGPTATTHDDTYVCE